MYDVLINDKRMIHHTFMMYDEHYLKLSRIGCVLMKESGFVAILKIITNQGVYKCF